MANLRLVFGIRAVFVALFYLSKPALQGGRIPVPDHQPLAHLAPRNVFLKKAGLKGEKQLGFGP
jgi:hypothetical protein